MNSMISEAIVVIGSRYLVRFVQLLYFIILARALSPQNFGIYGILTASIFLTAVIGNLGLRQAAVRLVGNKTITDGQVALTNLAALPVLTIGCCFFLWWFNQEQFIGLGQFEKTSIWISVLCVLLISLMQGVFLGRGQTSLFAAADAGPRLLQAAFVLVLWAIGQLTFVSAMITFALGYLIFVPWILWKTFQNAQLGLPKLGDLSRMIRVGLVYAISLFLIALQGRIGLFFLNSSSANESVGNFFAAQRATEIFLDVATAAAIVLFSETARATDARSSYINATKTAVGIFLMFLIVGLVLAALAPFVVHIVLGKAYAGATLPLAILGLGLAPAAATRVMNSVLSGIGKPWLSGSITGFGVALNALTCIFTVPLWGAAGASISLVLGQTIAFLGYVLVSYYMFKVKASDAIPDFSGVARKLRKKLRR